MVLRFGLVRWQAVGRVERLAGWVPRRSLSRVTVLAVLSISESI